VCGRFASYRTPCHLKVVKAAFEMIPIVEEAKTEKGNPTFPLTLRIGINTGPVVAGVVVNKKFLL